MFQLRSRPPRFVLITTENLGRRWTGTYLRKAEIDISCNHIAMSIDMQNEVCDRQFRAMLIFMLAAMALSPARSL